MNNMGEYGRVRGWGIVSEEEANRIARMVEELAKEVDKDAIEKSIKPFLEAVDEE